MQKRLLPYTFSSGNARPHETDISSSEVLDKFSTCGIFRWAYLIILSFLFAFFSILSLSFFLPFLFPLSPLSSSLAAVFLSHSDPLYSRLFLHLHRDRSLFIVWGIGALENFVCVTIKLTWSSIGLCNIPRRPNHSPPHPPSSLAINWQSIFYSPLYTLWLTTDVPLRTPWKPCYLFKFSSHPTPKRWMMTDLIPTTYYNYL